MKFVNAYACTVLLIGASVAVQQASAAPASVRAPTEDVIVSVEYYPGRGRPGHRCSYIKEKLYSFTSMVFGLLDPHPHPHWHPHPHPHEGGAHHRGPPPPHMDWERLAPLAVLGQPVVLSGEGGTESRGMVEGEADSGHHHGGSGRPGMATLDAEASVARERVHAAHLRALRDWPFRRRVSAALMHLGRGPALVVCIILGLGLHVLLRAGVCASVRLVRGVNRHVVALAQTIRFHVARYRGDPYYEAEETEICTMSSSLPEVQFEPYGGGGEDVSVAVCGRRESVSNADESSRCEAAEHLQQDGQCAKRESRLEAEQGGRRTKL